MSTNESGHQPAVSAPTVDIAVDPPRANPRKPYFIVRAAILLFFPPLLYAFSVGPAARLYRWGLLSDEAKSGIEWFYTPLTRLHRHQQTPELVRSLMEAWVELWLQ